MLPTHFPIAIAVSEVVAAWLVWKLWRSDDVLFFKVTLTAIAVVPVLGPIVVLWLARFPDPAPDVLRDKYKWSSDVYDRWKDVIREKDPAVRFKKWRDLMGL